MALASPEEAFARAEELGNSPVEYSSARVRGRVVITTTTNGTQALVAARHAALVIVAAYRNRSAVVAALREALPRVSGVTLLAAGQAGEPAVENLCCARSIAWALSAGDALRVGARIAPEPCEEVDLAQTPHAVALEAAGFGEDVRFALQRDVSPLVPTLVDGGLIARLSTPVPGA